MDGTKFARGRASSRTLPPRPYARAARSAALDDLKRHARLRRIAQLLALLLSGACADLAIIDTDEKFEEQIMMTSHCWAVLFTSATRKEETEAALKMVESAAATVPGLTLAMADVDAVKAFASEFNVRKRMVPRLLLFNSRARMANVIKLGESTTWQGVQSELKDGLAENKDTDGEGRLQKLTLAIGSGKEEV